MKNKTKNNRAITLIALVVTIIILLILAGVTIGLTTNQTGLFEKAKLATDEYNNTVDKENALLTETTNEIEAYIEGNSRDTVTISREQYESLLNANNYTTDPNGQVIGTWTNGKPLYRKVVNLSTSGNFSRGWNNNYAFLGSDIETVVHLELRRNGANYSMLYSTVSSTGYLSTYQETADTYGKPTTAIIEYTKTTDPLPASE